MNRKRDVIIALLYIILFFPLIFIFLELTSLVFNKSNKFSPATIYDPLTGWRNNCTNKEVNPENLDFLICDKNGFIKTPYETNKNSKNIYGILLLGNSVAMGEGLHGFNNEKTFASQLEKHLRLEDP